MCRHVGILSIQGSQFQIAEVPLKTVRPFQLAEVVLTKAAEDESTKVNLEDKDSITAYLRKEVRRSAQLDHAALDIADFIRAQVEALIEKAEREWEERHAEDVEKVEMMLPLIRLKVGIGDREL